MKKLSFVLAAFVTGTIVSTGSSPVQAQYTTFQCRDIDGVPTTVAETSRGTVPVVHWKSDYFSESGWTPEARCQEVSQRFQTYHENDQLKYLVTGIMNHQDVVCTSNAKKGGCQNLLFTLKPISETGKTPSQTLRELMNVRERKGSALNETEERFVVEMEQFLNEASVLEEGSSQPDPQSGDSHNSVW